MMSFLDDDSTISIKILSHNQNNVFFNHSISIEIKLEISMWVIINERFYNTTINIISIKHYCQ